MVCTLFVVNTDILKYKIVDHIDGNCLNNNYTNLRWTCAKGNANNINHRLDYNTRSVVQYTLEKKLIAEFKSRTDASKQTGCSADMIGHCCAGTARVKTVPDKEGVRYIWN